MYKYLEKHKLQKRYFIHNFLKKSLVISSNTKCNKKKDALTYGFPP